MSTQASKGAAFSLSHDFWQVGYLRPQNRHRHYGNLYFVGGGTHPGTGLPIVLISAKLAAERIVGEIGAHRPAPLPTTRLWRTLSQP
jgi:phytoene desaturase